MNERLSLNFICGYLGMVISVVVSPALRFLHFPKRDCELADEHVEEVSSKIRRRFEYTVVVTCL